MKKGLFLILLFVVFRLLPVSAQKKDDFRVVGYYSMRSAMEGFKKFPFNRVTHVNLYFLNPDTLGNYAGDYSALVPFIKKAHSKGVKVLFSIGGGGAHPYYHRLLRDDMRGTIIERLIGIVTKYDLDGIDNDLEHGDIDENYEDFNVELNKALKQHNKLFTAAIVVTDPDLFSDRTLEQFDFVNIMSYDHTGPWRPDRPGPHASYQHFVEDLDYFAVRRGIPAGEINLGVPFYGYAFGPDPDSKAKSMNYRQITETYDGSENNDQLSIEDGYTLYYNGIPTIKKKTQLAKERAAGIMIWQLGGDARGRKSLLKTINEVGYDN